MYTEDQNGREEHEHTTLCFADETADVETYVDWEATVPNSDELTGNWSEESYIGSNHVSTNVGTPEVDYVHTKKKILMEIHGRTGTLRCS